MRRLSVSVVVACGVFALCSASSPVRAQEVDLALVLAVDVSSSMDSEELRLQRAGYVAAISDPGVVAAIASGLNGKIALSYLEWAGPGFQVVTVPWRLISDETTARAFAAELQGKPLIGETDTSISAALDAAAGLFKIGNFSARRRVIDISGDGPNTAGRHVVPSRNALIARGITVNGLPLVLARPAPGGGETGDLLAYYRDCVTGGDGSFVFPVQNRDEMASAIRMKLEAEIIAMAAPVRLVLAGGELPADCTMGQKDFYE